jgi:hypothetical protein
MIRRYFAITLSAARSAASCPKARQTFRPGAFAGREAPLRYRSLGFVMSACLCGALFGGCAGGSSSVAQSAGTIPSTGQRGTAPTSGRQAHSGARRTLSAAQCYGAGPYSFVGGPGSTQPGNSDNFAAGQYSTVTGGSSNEACDGWSIIAGGFDNLISISVTGGDGDGFIGGGQYNVVTGIGSNEAVVAGENNTVSNADSAIVAGDNNTVSSEYAFLGGGNANSLSGEYGVLVGGLNNSVSGEGAYIAAGGYNTASGEGAVDRRRLRTTRQPARSRRSRAGTSTRRPGTYSFAAARAQAPDRPGPSCGATARTAIRSSPPRRAYEFLARASGGVTLWTNAKAATIGANLAAGLGNVGVGERSQREDRCRAARRCSSTRQGRVVADRPLELQVRARRAARRPDGAGLLRSVRRRRGRQAHHVDRRGRRRARGNQSAARTTMRLCMHASVR